MISQPDNHCPHDGGLLKCVNQTYIVERSRKRWDSDMTVYWVVNFDLRAGSGNKYLEWLKSEEAQKIRGR
jgi:hypothetical protein